MKVVIYSDPKLGAELDYVSDMFYFNVDSSKSEYLPKVTTIECPRYHFTCPNHEGSLALQDLYDIELGKYRYHSITKLYLGIQKEFGKHIQENYKEWIAL